MDINALVVKASERDLYDPSALADEAVKFEITHWTPYPEPEED